MLKETCATDWRSDSGAIENGSRRKEGLPSGGSKEVWRVIRKWDERDALDLKGSAEQT